MTFLRNTENTQEIDRTFAILIAKITFKQIKKHRNPSKGGNYSNNLRFRIDNNFFKYVNNAVLENKITYTDAFSIVGVGYKGYKILSKGVR